ncbi:hypothetical protein SAMD00019534_069890 [Acytostelium subglobosum LB1]|uniref:hypothetical protein n=1 Tax=Acytostelium subglobosum LB1 TaxID=1410327 RepID=UPI000644C2A8|nr:hypothetical protein SAMD00019534_069890 [Acytostelium subglobosum LB1]GAM23814.1 hypothetical protein SAMD00019534_069890 [Acytostelium subglobosum LB1]|eukprot:XP_012753555.1 hypothetical protein SAMD00019534_069890 [Acytostelium subglobosum LB1]
MFCVAQAQTAGEDRCRACQNALQTLNEHLPLKSTREELQKILKQTCNNLLHKVGEILPIVNIILQTVHLPTEVCSVIQAQDDPFINGILDNLPTAPLYTNICERAHLCEKNKKK